MTYDKKFKDVVLNVYNNLKTYNIKGNHKKEFIQNLFKIHINSVYTWKKELVNLNNKPNKNKKINDLIETEIINCFNKKIENVIKIKKILNKKYNIYLSYKDIKYVLKKHNLINTKIIKKIKIDEEIIKIIKENNTITAREITFIIKEKFNIIRSITYVYNILKKHNYSYKNVKVISNIYPLEEQKQNTKALKAKLNNMENIISIDEMSVKTFENIHKGWSHKNENCLVYKNLKPCEYKRYSILMATSNKKIINYTIVEKAVNGIKFNKFMIKLRIMDKENKNIYFMDNAIIHKTKSLDKIKREYNIKIIYNVPYHSEYNPIEMVFSLLRRKIRINKKLILGDIIKIINEFMKNIEPIKLHNMYNKCYKNIEKFIT